MARKALGPATLAVVQAVRRAVPADRPLLVAVSGGADSLALAFGVRQVAIERRQACTAITVDHGLQSGSAERAARVASQLADIGYRDVITRTVQVGQRNGPEADARTARYTALDREAQDHAADLVLGHTRDDQAETVLLGLTRGSGGRSLAGMPARAGRRLRPLLAVGRDTTRDACAECGLSVWDDPHNRDPRFTRARIRHSVMPLLEDQLGPGIVDALVRTAGLVRADADLLDRLATELLESARHGADLDCTTLAAAEPALRSRALKMWLRQSGAAETSYERVGAVERLITDWHGQGPLQLPGLVVSRQSGRLVGRVGRDMAGST